MPTPSQPAALIWMRERQSTGRPAVTEARIVETAIALADAEGLDALSMRRIATEMKSGTTSLYRHIANKDELIELMIDTVYAEFELPEGEQEMIPGLAAHARRFRQLLLRHSWLAQQASRRAALGPNVIRVADYQLGLIDAETGDPSQATMVTHAINTYVIGAAAAELADSETQRRTGMTEREWQIAVGEYVTAVVESGKYPYFSRRIWHADDGDATARFEFGLDNLLRGITATLAAATEKPLSQGSVSK